MAYDRQKVIDIAIAEVGYLEKASASQLDHKTANAGSSNRTKYARDLDAISFFNGRKQGAAWCAVWVCWDFVQAYGVEGAKALLCLPAKAASNCAAGCRYLRNYFKNRGQLHTSNPQPGDVIFFYSKDKSSIAHTGLVYKVDSAYVYTVEGNTSSASGVVANGGAVAYKKYSLNYNRLAGYGRPAYGDNGPETAPAAPKEKDEQIPVQSAGGATSGKTGGKAVTVTLATLRKGDEDKQVKTVQRLLNALGYDCGKDDGIFGSKTFAAAKAFQKAKGLEADGIIGAKTWAALLK